MSLISNTMKELIIAPIIASLILTFTLGLIHTAEDVSHKVNNFAENMDIATDCAFRGIDIYKCSPELSSNNFKQDMKDYKKNNEEFVKKLENTSSELLHTNIKNN